MAADDTAGTVLMRLATSGGALLERTFERLEAGENGTAQVEDESVSYASKMSIADGRLTWTEPAEQILARFRGVTPEPGAWCELAGNRFKIGGLAVADERLVASLTEANGGPLAPGCGAPARERRCWSAPVTDAPDAAAGFSPPVRK